MKLQEEYGVWQVTIYDLKAQKDKIQKFYPESDSIKGMAECKTLLRPKNYDLDKIL